MVIHRLMNERNAWLRTSLFCKMENWRILIKEGIDPFLKNRFEESHIQCFNLELNSLNGENIRLALYTKRSNLYSLKNELNLFFDDFFSTNLSYDESDTQRIGFMLLSPNIIYYDLYDFPSIHPIEEKYYLKFYREFSQIILQSLGSAEIDTEAILTLGFYLNIALIKCLFENEKTYSYVLQAFTIGKSKLRRENFVDDLNLLSFEDNRDIFKEITLDIFSSNNPDTNTDLPSWIGRWFHLCKCDIEREVSSGDVIRIADNRIYYRISYFIKKNLGISEIMNGTLQYFISSILFETREIIFYH